ncbi:MULTISPECIES: aspartate kinase [unclassified Clostridium]|uniref:Aspartokinase n=1 Tax=Clostridium botulinum (strain Eklund 17B / Type B) TaxID=935198 RepID=B2TN16_CLOBB|nr:MULTISPECIES: aspartate kinase [unclassified Clostridium]ACD23249.1 aspartate kinase [Clostridium botulinum B str. Eklund 17B (NRP)]MBN1051407.1 aspartate kinase [Clostridium botulinum]MBY6975124.1 aspartate kinase [Clostridium botulinum]MBY7000105.1 aspartate kinase [Clostridium botulinum]MCR1274879.1 aspartate kinase [Clostridium botulinum]
MNTIITKFGGSSLADAEQFKKVKNIITSNKSRKFVIPSAPGKRTSKDSKITDLLYLCHAHINTGISLDDVFNHINSRYIGIVNDLKLDLNIKSYLDLIKKDIENGASSDYAASRGEYLNAIILSNYLGFEFIDAKDVIKFNTDGCLNYDETLRLLKEKLSSIDKAVIPGFYGSDNNGDIVTFSRGGSDVTGALVTASLNADLYENWTDVSGFLMADPRIISNPKPISTITYTELRELSYMGASVLHEEAIFPVRKAGIPINIKNTNKPEDKGTFIVEDSFNDDSQIITGIAGKKDFTVISIAKALMNSELGFCRKILSILEQHNVSFENMPSGIDTVCLVISDSQLKNKTALIVEEIKRTCNPDTIEVHPNMALIATVGKGMAKQKGVASKVFTALSKANVNIRMIDQGSSEINILVGIENDNFEKAIAAIYNAFN